MTEPSVPPIGDAVEQWFAARSHPFEPELRRVRNIIMGADHRVSESVKWQVPTFSYDGNIVSFSTAKKFVGLMFHRGAQIPGDHPRLDGDTKLVRTIRLADMAAVEEAAGDLRDIIRAWCDWRDGGGT